MLGKKSWNVYNADNIARVRRDEAQAKAVEEAEEQRMQEVDAARRLAILRGEVPPPIEDEKPEVAAIEGTTRELRHRDPATRKKPRKRAGEDDTDFELRVAREQSNASALSIDGSRKQSSSAPIVDRGGHIDLFGDERSRAHAEKNEEAEKEKAKKKREYEDQYTMRFSNAAGKSGHEKPWYSASDVANAAIVPKDVWGNEDPRRKEREAQRTTASDPLAMMKRGAAQVREVNKERKKFHEERNEDMRQMVKEERRRERRDREEHHRSRKRSRSPSHDRRRSRERHRHRSRERRDENERHRRGERERDRNRDGGRRHRRHSTSPRRHSRPQSNDL